MSTWDEAGLATIPQQAPSSGWESAGIDTQEVPLQSKLLGDSLARVRGLLDSQGGSEADQKARAAVKLHHKIRYGVERYPSAGGLLTAQHDLMVINSANKIKEGTADGSDYAAVATYLNYQERSANQGFGGQVLDAITQIPGFAIDFALSGGAYSGAKAATKKVIGGTAKGIVGKIAQASIPRAIGSAAQTLASPQLVAKNATGRMMPGFTQTVDASGRPVSVDVGDDVNFIKAIGPAYADVATELATERAGGILAKGAGKAFDLIPGSAKVRALKAAISEKWLGKPGRTQEMLNETLKAAGWDGVVGQMMEERAGDVTRLITGLETPEQNTTGQIATGDWAKAGQNLAVEGLAFSVPGGVSMAIQRVAQLKTLRDAKPFVSAEDGQTYGIPGDSRQKRKEELNSQITTLEQEIQNASPVRSDQTEVPGEQVQSGPNLRGNGQVEVPTQPAGEVASEGPQVQVDPEAMFGKPGGPTGSRTSKGKTEWLNPDGSIWKPGVVPEQPQVDPHQAMMETLDAMYKAAPEAVQPKPPEQVLAQGPTDITIPSEKPKEAAPTKKNMGRKPVVPPKSKEEADRFIRDVINRGPAEKGPAALADWVQKGFGQEHYSAAIPEGKTLAEVLSEHPMMGGKPAEAPTKTPESLPTAPQPIPAPEPTQTVQTPPVASQEAEKPNKTRMDLILDEVERSGKEMTVKLEAATPEVLRKGIQAAKDRGLLASTDGRNLLIQPPVKEAVQAEKPKRGRKAQHEPIPQPVQPKEPAKAEVIPPKPSPEPIPPAEEKKAQEASFKRLTAPDGPIREERRQHAQQARERELELRKQIGPLETQLKNTRRNARNKRGELSDKIHALEKQMGEQQAIQRREEKALNEAHIEDFLEKPDLSEAQREAGLADLARHREQWDQSNVHEQNVSALFHQEAQQHADKLNKDEITAVAERARRDFHVGSRSTPAQIVESTVKQQIAARPTVMPSHVGKNLSAEQRKEFDSRMAEAAKGKDFYEKQQAIQKEAEAADKEAFTVKQKEVAAQAEVARKEAAIREVEAMKENRQRAKSVGREERFWKELTKRANAIKGKKGTVEVVGKGDERFQRKAEILDSKWAITESEEDGKKTYSLTHIPTGLNAVSGTSANVKQFLQLSREAGADANDIPDVIPKGWKMPEIWGKLVSAWDRSSLYELPEDVKEKLVGKVGVTPTNVKADIVLDSFDLGAHDSKLNTVGLQQVKEMAKEVPEFAYEPIFTVNSKKQLVFRDGVTYTLNPESFNLHPSELTEGQTVGINLEDLGLKQITASETVARTLKNAGFSNVRDSGSGVTASWGGRKVELRGKDDKWSVVQSKIGSADVKVPGQTQLAPSAVKMAEQALAKIHFLEGGQKPKTALQQSADKATKEAFEELDKLTKLVGGDKPNTGVSPEAAYTAARVVYKFGKAGVLKFGVMIESLTKSHGKPAVDAVLNYLELAWDKAQASGKFPGMEPRVAPEPIPAAEGDTNLTSIKNEIVNELRAERGKEELPEVPAQTREEWMDVAAQRIAESNGAIGPSLVAEIHKQPRNLSNIEVAVLQAYYRGVNNAFETASEQLFQAVESKDPAAIAVAQTQADNLLAELDNIELATKAAGREWGRAGVARQIMLAKDFSIAAMTRKARVANGGQPLNAEQTAEIQKLAKRVAELEKQLTEQSGKVADLERERRAQEFIDKDVADVKKSRVYKKSVKREKAEAKVAAAWKEFNSLASGKLYSTPAELVIPAAKVIKAYVELGIVSFGEFMANARKNLGTEQADKAQAAFQAAWDDMKQKGEIPAVELEQTDTAGISRLARQIQRALVELGITKRDEVVDTVHESLKEFWPEITRRETMDALSGYGQFSPLTSDEISRIIRDINGQLQQLGKLDDMQQGQAPAKTGHERRVPSDDERRLIQQVNEAKKRGGFNVLDPERQLKTALDAAKTATRNRIADLEHEIQKKELIVRKKTDLKADSELEALRKQRDALREAHKDLFPPKGATQEQKIAAAAKALDRAIELLQAQIASGDLDRQARPAPLSSPQLDAKRARLEALRAQKKVLKDVELARFEGEGGSTGKTPPLSQEELSRRAYKADLLKRIADYQQRVANGEFTDQPKKEPRVLTREELDLKRKLEDVKQEFFQRVADWRLSQMSPIQKVWDYTKEAAHLSRALMTSFDLSAVFRQGGIGAFSHPGLALKAGKKMLQAFVSRQAEFDSVEEIRNRPNAQLYETAGLSITEEDGKMTRQEEAFMGRWGRKIAPVRASSRAYMTFLNNLRADMFDLMVENLGRSGAVTLDEAKVLATYVNVATGRADFGKWNSAMANLNTVFFAPRFVASRFQFLAMPFYLPFTKTSGRVKQAIAMEYGRYAAGVGTFMGLSVLLGALMAQATGDDDWYVTIELDPRSSDFGKIKIGDTRIDPLSGLSQVIVLLAKTATGQRKAADGRIIDLVGDKRPYGGKTWIGEVGRFAWSKTAPVISSGIELRMGEDFVGNKTTPAGTISRAFLPLSFREIVQTMTSNGIPLGTSIELLNILGMGTATYGPRTEYLTGTEEERKAQVEKDLKTVDWNDQLPAYAEFITDEQREQFKDRIQEKRGQVIFNATYSGKNEDELKTRDKNREHLKEMKAEGVTLEEARALLKAHYLKPDSQGKRGSITEGYYEKQRALTTLYK